MKYKKCTREEFLNLLFRTDSNRLDSRIEEIKGGTRITLFFNKIEIAKRYIRWRNNKEWHFFSYSRRR